MLKRRLSAAEKAEAKSQKQLEKAEAKRQKQLEKLRRKEEAKRLKEQAPQSPLFNENHKREQKRLEWCEDIISYYKTLI